MKKVDWLDCFSGSESVFWSNHNKNLGYLIKENAKKIPCMVCGFVDEVMIGKRIKSLVAWFCFNCAWSEQI
jgi:hypothetical protein